MNDIQINLKKYRNFKKMSYSQLSLLTGIAKSTLQRYETGTTQKIPMEAIPKIETAMNLPKGTLMGWVEDNTLLQQFENIYPIKTKKFPLLGEISCGKPIYCKEEYETFIEANEAIRADFCLKAKGDSMINARIFDGDIVFVRKQPTVENGEIAAVIIDNKATLKRVYYYKSENKIVLAAENPKYAPLVYSNNELEHINILGHAVAFMSYVK